MLGLLGVLTAMALPNVVKLGHKSRRVEAYNVLNGIYVAQAEYFVLTGMYADTFDVLGFDVTASTRLDERTIQAPHYTYTLVALVQDGVPNANFRATATGDIDPADCDAQFEFGHHGKPFFLSGPYDTPERCQLIASNLAEFGDNAWSVLSADGDYADRPMIESAGAEDAEQDLSDEEDEIVEEPGTSSIQRWFWPK